MIINDLFLVSSKKVCYTFALQGDPKKTCSKKKETGNF